MHFVLCMLFSNGVTAPGGKGLLLSLLHFLLLTFSPPSPSVKPCARSYPVSTLANLWSHTCESPCITLQLMAATLYITAVPPANQGSPHANLGRNSAQQFQSNPLVLPQSSNCALAPRFGCPMQNHSPIFTVHLYPIFSS